MLHPNGQGRMKWRNCGLTIIWQYMRSKGWRKSQPQTFQPQSSTPDLSTQDFSTMNFPTPDFSTPDFSTLDFSTPNFSTMNFSTPDFSTPAVKSGVERSGVEAWGWKVWGWNVLQPIHHIHPLFFLTAKVSTMPSKLNIYKSCGKVSLVEQPLIEFKSVAYLELIIKLLSKNIF